MKRPIIILFVLIQILSGSSIALGMKKKSYLPLNVGAKWIYESKDEVETVCVEEFTEVAKEKAYRIEWYSKKRGADGKGYNIKTEYWVNTKDGVKLLGRRSHGFEKVLAKPFYFIKYPVKDKDTWEGEINLGYRKAIFKYSNENSEKLDTKIGKISAVRIRHSVFSNIIDTWYSPGIGIIKISYYKKIDGKLIETNSKIIRSYNPKEQ
jgi:hypothetical protein